MNPGENQGNFGKAFVVGAVSGIEATAGKHRQDFSGFVF
jgi:hypothetical protein